MKKKNIVIIIVILLLIILLFPIQINKLKDGGSIEFKTLLYSVTKYHKLAPENSDTEYIDGIGIKILGMEIFNNTEYSKNKTEAMQRNKINEVSNNDNEDKEYNSFVGTVLEETTTYMIVEPNEDEEERKSADKIRINYGTDHYDYLYGIGRKVVIYYIGDIMESYPAQINTNILETDGYAEFELTVKKSDKIAKTKILNNQELYKDNSDFDLYYYGLDEVNIFVDDKTMSLEDALRSGKMTVDGILAKANQDVSDGTIKSVEYDDGGTAEWYYDKYTIIKRHSLDGNRDVYIGVPKMRLNNIK